MTKNTLLKTLSILITFAMLLALLPGGFITVSAATAESGSCGDNLTWMLEDGVLTISGTGDMYSYTYKNYNGSYITTAPWGSKSFSTVIINSSVTSIGEYAFYRCTGLTSVTIGDSVTSIGNEAFSGCTGLTSVTIPDGVTSIGGGAFYGCTGLTSVTIGNGVTSIGEQAFYGCTGLTSVTIPDSVTSIGEWAFLGTGYSGDASNWKNGVLYIGKWLIYAKNDISGAYSIKNDTVGIADDAFYGCKSLTSVTIGDSVASIGESAFWDCAGLTSVTIPDSVASIGESAFYRCTGLTSVTIGNGVTSIGYEAFYGCTGLTGVTIPGSVTSIGYRAFYRCTGLTSVTIGNGVTSIDVSAFYGCTGLTCITIPDSVTSIGGGAFYGCTGLTSITIPNGVTSIDGDAFYDCAGLTSITIPDSVTSIGWCAFWGCTGLTSITIGNGVTSIGDHAFNYCTGLTSVNITDIAAWCAISFSDTTSNPITYAHNLYLNGELVTDCVISGSVTSIGAYAFSGCTGLTSVTIADGVTSISYNAFYNCTGLTSVTIGDSVTSISDHAFDGCTGLTSVTIGNGVTSIGYYAFSGCTDLKHLTTGMKTAINLGINTWETVTMLDSVTDIGNWAFYNCTGLTSVTIGNGVTSIGEDAFRDCTGLTSVTMGNSVKSIGEDAFCNCSKLSSVTIGNSVTSIGEDAFYGCTGLTSVTIGNSVTSIGKYAFYGCAGLTVKVFRNTYAENYARNNSIKYSYVLPSEITISRLPDKLSYLEAKERLDVSGGEVTIVYNNGYTTSVSMLNSMVSGFNNTKVGSQMLTVTCDGKTATFNVTIVAKSLSSIAVTVLPTKTSYIEGKDALDVTGGKITIYYNNDTSETIAMTSDMVSGFDNSIVGPQALTVTYEGMTATFDVTIVAKSIASIAITTPPAKMSYLEGKDALDVTGGKITLYYNNDTSEVIDMTADMVSGFDNTKAGSQRLTVTYGGKTAAFNVTIVAKSLSSIAVTTLPTKTSYLEAKDTLDVTGGKITLYYNNDTSETIAMTSYMVSGFNNTKVGSQMLTVTYDGKTATFDVTIVAKSISRIAVTTLPSKLTYVDAKAEDLDVSGGRLTVYYDNDTADEIDLTADMVSGFDNAGVGVQTLTVSYGGAVTSFDVEVLARAISGIAVSALPGKTSYLEAKDELDLTGGAITVSYNDDTSREAYMVYNNGEASVMFADDFSVAPLTVSGFDNSVVGSRAVTVGYAGYSASFDVEIVARELCGISVVKAPTKTVYEARETLDLTGARIMLNYNNDTYQYANLISAAGVTRMLVEGESASREVVISGFDSNCGGIKTVVISYGGFEASLEVTVNGGGVKGDADGDGEITVADALISLRVAAKLAEPTSELIACCDTDGDGEITVADALAILRVAAKLVDSL